MLKTITAFECQPSTDVPIIIVQHMRCWILLLHKLLYFKYALSLHIYRKYPWTLNDIITLLISVFSFIKGAYTCVHTETLPYTLWLVRNAIYVILIKCVVEKFEKFEKLAFEKSQYLVSEKIWYASISWPKGVCFMLMALSQ